MGQKTLLSTKEVAAALGTSYKVLLNLAKTADFPALRIGAKKLKIPANQLEEWVRRKASESLTKQSGRANNTSAIGAKANLSIVRYSTDDTY